MSLGLHLPRAFARAGASGIGWHTWVNGIATRRFEGEDDASEPVPCLRFRGEGDSLITKPAMSEFLEAISIPRSTELPPRHEVG
jgi:hypothetical protein